MKDFTQGSVSRQLLAFSIPLLIGSFLQTFIEAMNMFWVGRMLGHEAIAAVATSMPILMFLISVLVGMSMAGNIIVAQAYGAKDIRYMEKTFANSLVLSIALCVIISAGGVIFSRHLLHLINCPPEITDMANSFFRIVILGLSFNFVYNWYSGIQRGVGDAVTPLYILMFNAVLNLAGVPFMVKNYGLIGAPIANIISGVLSLIAGYIYASRKNPFFKVREWDFTVDWRIIEKLFTIGVPASLQMVIISFAGAAIMSIINRFGATVTAAAGIGIQCDQLTMLPSMSIGMAVTSIAGQNISAGRMDRVSRILKYGIMMSAMIALFFMTVIFLFPHTIAGLFYRSPESAAQVIPHTVGYLRIVCFSYMAFAFTFSFMSIVRGAGDTIAALGLSFISAVVLRVPLAWILSQKTSLGERGIWTAILITAYLTAVINYFYYKSGRWKRVKVLG